MIKRIYKKEIRQSIAWSSGCAIFGYILSLIFKDPDIFPRFGALVACFGIYFMAYRIIPTLNSARKNTGAVLNALEGMLREGVKPNEYSLVNKIKSESNEFEKESSEKLLQFESKIVMAGTIIWAFGDLLVVEYWI